MKNNVKKVLKMILLFMTAFNTYCYADSLPATHTIEYSISYYIGVAVSLGIIVGIGTAVLIKIYKSNQLDENYEKNNEIKESENKEENN